MKRRLHLIFCLALFLQACEHATTTTSPSTLPVTSMHIGSQTFNLEIATSEQDQTVGLMHRDGLPSDHGMIFVNNDQEVRTFWNHDVHFGLDLLFLDTGGNIVSIKQMPAYDEHNFSSDVPAQYVVELNSGTAAKVGVSVGTHLDLPADLKKGP